MDNLRYSWASPQEDEFALLALGAPSPYEALLVPSLMLHARDVLDFNALSSEDQDRWKATFSYFLRLLTVQQDKPMILKSPPHGYRIRILREMFPEARLVVIERNPYEVFASNLKLWQILTDRYSLERCSEDQVEEFVLSAYILHEKAIEEGTQHAKTGFWGFVRYEDLERQPVEQISRLYQELNLGNFETIRSPLEEHLTDVSGHVRNRFTLSRERKKKIEYRWGELIAKKGYTWPETHVLLEGS